MNLQNRMANKNITMYKLSKITGIPKTTIFDICTGKSSIERCSAVNVCKIAKALDCTVEDLLEAERYDDETGLPLDESYLEIDLPGYLEESLANMKKSWAKVDAGEFDMHWDLYWCELNADINSAEVNSLISQRQAGYLRDKYLRMVNEI